MISIAVKTSSNFKSKVKAFYNEKLSRFVDSYLEESKKALRERIDEKPIDYDGEIDEMLVDGELTEKTAGRVYVQNPQIAFIEFGTGTKTYTEQHPKAAELGMVRGAYGLGKGKNEKWTFRSDASNLRMTETSYIPKDAEGVIVTRGNPPNYILYDTAKKMKSREFIRNAYDRC